MQLHPHWCGAEGKTSIDGTAHCSGHYKAYTRLESRGYRTNNIVYRSAWLRDIGGFDERFRFQHEDIDLALRLIDAGATIGFCETMRVAHRFRDDKWELLKNCLRRRFDPLLMKKHPQRYRCCRGSPIPPSIALLAAAHVIAAGISISSPALSVVACAADAAYITVCTRSRTGTFCIATLRFWREWLSYLISPVLLFAALAYGSIKFRKIVIF
jgi:GT2 family glycosyltransferase